MKYAAGPTVLFAEAVIASAKTDVQQPQNMRVIRRIPAIMDSSDERGGVIADVDTSDSRLVPGKLASEIRKD